MKISVATTYTNPDERQDPWKEAITCYKDFADEIIVTGQDWPHDFHGIILGKHFMKALRNQQVIWYLGWI